MASTMNAFPYFHDGDVKIVLSENPEDTLSLHTSILARHSDFFKASLEKLGWSENKYIRKQGGTETEVQMKLLELDFDGSDTFPLLMGSTFETAQPEMKRKRELHNDQIEAIDLADPQHMYSNAIDTAQLAKARYPSTLVIAAYKIGFALLYDLRIELQTDETAIRNTSLVIPVVVDFFDAYGFLPTYVSQVNSMIFGHGWSGYDIIGQNPFQMLQVACKLQSPTIYQEAMKHAVGLSASIATGALEPGECPIMYLSDVGETELHTLFIKSTKDLKDRLEGAARELLSISPRCCDKLGLARDIGLAIWRGWVLDNIGAGPDYNHQGFVILAQKRYDVSDIIRGWSSKNWEREVGVRFGHVHRVVENGFNDALEWEGVHTEAKPPMGRQMHAILSPVGELDRYFSTLAFADGYEYPWTTKQALPSYTPPTLMGPVFSHERPVSVSAEEW